MLLPENCGTAREKISELTIKKLYMIHFFAFENILPGKLASYPFDQSKDYGFAQFDNKESAQKAMEHLNDMLQEHTLLVARQIPKIVFIKNFSESKTDEDLNKSFGVSGQIANTVMMRDADGKSNELQIYQRQMTPLELLCCQLEEI
ncbi:hypothetical protein GQ457_16G021640 [Hibiscus cannabinus]